MTVMPLEWVLGRDKKHAIGTWKRHKSIVKLLVSKWKNIIEKEKKVFLSFPHFISFVSFYSSCSLISFIRWYPLYYFNGILMVKLTQGSNDMLKIDTKNYN